MKTIPLGRGLFAIVDDCDFEIVSSLAWHCISPRGKRYAQRNGRMVKGKRSKPILMHRYIMGVGAGVMVDHINGDGLDNRRRNLRIANHSTNGMNRSREISNKTGFKGVIYQKRLTSKPFAARIGFGGKNKHLGYFQTAVEAATAYDEAARKYHGDFARTNFGGGNV